MGMSTESVLSGSSSEAPESLRTLEPPGSVELAAATNSREMA
jgi:hypothetical protein